VRCTIYQEFYHASVDTANEERHINLILASLILAACYRYIVLVVLVRSMKMNTDFESFHKYISNFNLVCLLLKLKHVRCTIYQEFYHASVDTANEERHIRIINTYE
jgi:hypothetical protein